MPEDVTERPELLQFLFGEFIDGIHFDKPRLESMPGHSPSQLPR
jgi:hypothetical protein